jgi:hypothetical protein
VAPEDTYNSLVSMKTFPAVSDEDALCHIAQLVDLSVDLGKVEGLRRAIDLASALARRKMTPGRTALLDYYAGNAWAGVKGLVRLGDSRWEWEQEEAEKMILHYRKALSGLHELSADQVCGVLTNLANAMEYVGRFIEAIAYWNKALSRAPSFPMAHGNKGVSLYDYSRFVYNAEERRAFRERARAELDIALAHPLHDTARKNFEQCRARLESETPAHHLDDAASVNDANLGSSEAERQYRRWCLEKTLFLNPLNDLGPNPVAARDRLVPPGIVVKLDEGPHYPGFFNQLKQEFVSARYLLYEGLHACRPHFSDRGVLLFNTLDYPVYSLAAEKMRLAYRMAYSLFDKIAFFLSHYLRLRIPERSVNFRTCWYDNSRREDGLRPEFRTRKNWPLRGLFWLSKDLYERRAGFKEALEPDAQQLDDIRNHLEHKYLKLHGESWARSRVGRREDLDGLTDNLAFSVDRHEFVAKTLNLIRTARAALIYLALAIRCEETQRAKARKPGATVGQSALDVWEDDWKI